MSLIFISHSSKDSTTASALRERLAEQGHNSVFLDFDPEDGIPAGRDWEQELYRSIRGCRAVIVLCSRHSMASRWCFMEITHARALGKPLFPVKIDTCDLDGVLADRQIIDLHAEPEAGLQRLWRGLVAAGIDPADAFDWDGRRSPYPGLLAFQEEDAAVFFGREDEIAEGLDLLNRVRQFGQAGLVMVLGASGTGKSSLVRAGLLPRLRRDVERWLVVDPFRPRDDPARELAGVLGHAFERVGRKGAWQSIHERLTGELVAHLRVARAASGPAPARTTVTDDQRRFVEQLGELEAAVPSESSPRVHRYLRLLRAAAGTPGELSPSPAGRATPASQDGHPLVEMAADLRIRAGRGDAKVLLVVDQFEELLGKGGGGAEGFLHFLRAGLEPATSPLLVLGTMRSDFLGAFQRSPALLGLRHESLSLGPMSREGVVQIIEGPAEIASIDLEPGLVQALVDDAQTEDSLPILAFTLRELHERHGEDRLLGIDDYREKLGGLHGAVAKSADAVLGAASIVQRDEALLRKAFLDLARATDDGRYARRPRAWDDFPPAIHPLLERFVQARLLVSSGSSAGRTLEVAHEALFHAWDRLREWLAQSAEALRLRQEVQYGARTWDAAGRVEEDLWRGGRLARARELIHSGDLLLDALDLEFVEASDRSERAAAQAEDRRRKRELRRARIFAGVVGLAAVAAAGLGIYAASQRTDALASKARAESAAVEAESNARQAMRSAARANVGAALRLIEDGRSQQALAYLAAALRQDPANAAAAGWTVELLRWGGGAIPGQAMTLGSSAAGAEFSADGRTVVALATGSTFSRGGIQAFDAATGEPVPGPAALPSRLSADGRLALAVDHRGVEVRDAQSGEVVAGPIEHRAPVSMAGFTTDGRRVVIVAGDGTARVWSPERGEILRERLLHDGTVASARLNADRTELLTAWTDGTVGRWNLETGEATDLQLPHEEPIATAANSADGMRVATGSRDGTVRVWDVMDEVELLVRLEHDQAVRSLEFSPDAGRLLTVSGIQAWVWDLKTGRVRHGPWPHDGAVISATFSGDGRRVVTAWGGPIFLSEGTAGGAEVWDAATGRPIGVPLGHGESVRSARFDSGSRRLVTASTDGTARIWDVDTGRQIGAPLRHDGAVELARFGEGDRTLLTLWKPGAAGGQERRVTVWDLASGEPMAVVPTSATHIGDAAGSFATVAGSTVQIWSSRTGQPAGIPVFRGERIGGVALSGDGGRIAIQSNFEVHIIDTATRKPIGKPFRAGTGAVSMRFSFDGRRLMTAWAGRSSSSAFGAPVEGAARIWNPSTGEPVSDELRLPSQATYMEFSRDGRRVVAAYGGAQVWDAETGTAVGEPLRHDHAVHTAHFSPDGRRVVTAGGMPTRMDWMKNEIASQGRGAAQIWDAEMGGRVGGPLEHEDDVHSAWFSEDGRLVLTASHDGTARLWDVALPSVDESEPLARLAEVVGGYALSDRGATIPLQRRNEHLQSLRAGARRGTDDGTVVHGFVRWLFADQRARGITPLSRMRYTDYLELRRNPRAPAELAR